MRRLLLGVFDRVVDGVFTVIAYLTSHAGS